MMNEFTSEEPLSKKRKRISTSRGGYRFQQFSGREGKNVSAKNQVESDLDIMAWITNYCGQCCGKVPENESCCLLQYFKKNTGEFRFQVSGIISTVALITMKFV